ncbi:hypothetical protein KM043_004573 [Ampulex compressa]|nr:hypothetical protein KM043_004573 [Ampulex compressa]
MGKPRNINDTHINEIIGEVLFTLIEIKEDPGLLLQDQIVKMIIKGIIVLSLFVAHSLSAPSGCIESCLTSRGSHHVPSGYQQHAALRQSTNILQNLDYSRPGNWTEQNQYKTDGGHGNVYEEQGQYVEGGKTVRYYKQNYSSSYSSGHVNGGLSRLGEQGNNYRQNVLQGGQQHLDTQSTYDQSQSSHSIRQQQEYNRLYNQHLQSSSRNINRQSERLEDLGEHSENSRVSTYNTADTRPQNWHNENTYKTDDGHGRVYEEEGQYVTGPKTVKYYRRNYTSSYTSGGVPTVPIIQMPNIQNEMQRIHKQFDQFGREIHHQSTSEHVSHNQAGNLAREDLQMAETDHYGTQNHHQNIAVDIRNPVVSTIHIRPGQGVHNTEQQSSYEKHEKFYTSSNGHPTSYMPTTENSEYNMNVQNLQNSQLQQSRLTSDNLKSNMYNQHSGYYQSRPSQTQNYEEHWHASGHRKHSSIPSSNVAYTGGYSTNDYSTGHANYQQAAQQLDSLHTHTAQNSAHTASSGSLSTGVLDLGHTIHAADCDHGASEQQSSGFDDLTQQSEDLTQQSEDLTQQNEDLTQQNMDRTHQDKDFTQQTEDLTQQTQGKLEFGQQTQQQHYPSQQTTVSHKPTQQDEDDTQQSLGKLEFGQQTQQDHDQQSEDLTQQTSGKLEFGQQTQQDHDQQSEDLTQQSLGKLEFGQQTQQDHSQQSEDLTQQSLGKLEFGQQTQQDHSQQSEDLTQQSTGKLEFGQQAQQDHSQQSEDLTQQSLGKLEFGQQTQQDHSHQSEDLTQQSLGKLEFGQQTQHDSSQQSEDLTQQSLGKLEFGQQTQQDHSQQSEDLTQQSLGKLDEDLTQQSEDLTQQTTGHLEFGQQVQQGANHQKEDFTQQSESHSPQDEDLTQQTEGKFEFGEKPNPRHHTRHTVNNHNSEEDLTQTTSGKLEFGQHTQHTLPTSQEDIYHFTQQSQGQIPHHMGKLEFGQDMHRPYYPKRPITMNQDTEDYTQQNEDLTQHTGGFDDFARYPSGFDPNFGQTLQQPQHPVRPHEYFRSYPRPSEDFSQHRRVQMQIGQIHQSNSWPYENPVSSNKFLDDLPRENEDFTQQAKHDFDDDSHRRGRFNFEQQTQSVKPEKISMSSSWQDSFPHNNEELTQQTRDRLTQQYEHQSHDHWFQHAQHPQYPHDYTQQVVSHLGDKNKYNQVSQVPDNLQEDTFPQQSNDNPPGVLPLENERENTGDHVQQPGSMKPNVQAHGDVNSQGKPLSAPKPKPRPRYHRVELGSTIQSSSTTTEKTYDQSEEEDDEIPKGDTNVDSIQEPVEITPEGDIKDKLEDLVREQVQESKNQNKDDAKEVQRQTQGGGFEIDKGNVDQVHRLHKSNDATIGLQWHYTYHPSDLTNSEPLHGSFYPTLNYNSMGQQMQMPHQSIAGHTNQEDSQDKQQQSRPFDFDQQQTQDQTRFEHFHQQPSNMRPHGLVHIPLYRQEYNNVYRYPQQPSYVQHYAPHYDNSDQQLGSYQQSQDLEFGQQIQMNQETENTQKHIGRLEFGQTKEQLQDQQKASSTEEPIYKIEPRILEAYGGGPYDGAHKDNDEIYSRVPPNPSVTLPPIGGLDPWLIQEKPKEVLTTTTEVVPPEPINIMENTNEPTDESTNATEPTSEVTSPPSFWGRIGNKITTTFDKAKEKARGIFG